MTGTAPTISFENVTRRYGDAVALDRVSLDVRDRECLAVVGASGSGKTTLLRLINRLIDPSTGTVRVNGEDVQRTDAVALRRHIGYVFQGVGLFPHMTVAENIAITPRLLGWERGRIDARVDELIALVRLDAARYRNRLPSELSGGEAQRVGIARALAAEPRIMLMDEPFGALDPLTRDALNEDFRRLHETLGLTTVIITHDMLEALLIADRIAVIRAGRIVATDTPRALMTDAADEYVRELIAVPRRHAQRLNAFTGRA